MRGKIILDAADLDLRSYTWALSHGHAHSAKYGFLHRLVMERKLGRKLRKTEWVGHFNRKKLDCRRDNLILLKSRSEVQVLRYSAQRNSTSGVLGVSLRSGKWNARLRFKGLDIRRTCRSKAEAQRVRKALEAQYLPVRR